MREKLQEDPERAERKRQNQMEYEKQLELRKAYEKQLTKDAQ